MIRRQLHMHRHEDQQSENYVYFELKSEEGERTDGYYMTKQQYEDFGEPEDITVTVVLPGYQMEDDGEIVHRDAGTGLFVTQQYAEDHPDTTVKETNG